jgi:hypothetical protein
VLNGPTPSQINTSSFEDAQEVTYGYNILDRPDNECFHDQQDIYGMVYRDNMVAAVPADQYKAAIRLRRTGYPTPELV